MILPEPIDWAGRDKLMEFLTDYSSLFTEEENVFIEKMETSISLREGVIKEDEIRIFAMADHIHSYLDQHPDYQEEPRTPPCNTPDWKPIKKGDVTFELD